LFSGCSARQSTTKLFCGGSSSLAPVQKDINTTALGLALAIARTQSASTIYLTSMAVPAPNSRTRPTAWLYWDGRSQRWGSGNVHTGIATPRRHQEVHHRRPMQSPWGRAPRPPAYWSGLGVGLDRAIDRPWRRLRPRAPGRSTAKAKRARLAVGSFASVLVVARIALASSEPGSGCSSLRCRR
jgi:hypothetical protein